MAKITVKETDTPLTLQKKYGVPAKTILNTNGLVKLTPGQTINVPKLGATGVAGGVEEYGRRSRPNQNTGEIINPEIPNVALGLLDLTRPTNVVVNDSRRTRNPNALDYANNPYEGAGGGLYNAYRGRGSGVDRSSDYTQTNGFFLSIN